MFQKKSKTVQNSQKQTKRSKTVKNKQKRAKMDKNDQKKKIIKTKIK